MDEKSQKADEAVKGVLDTLAEALKPLLDDMPDPKTDERQRSKADLDKKRKSMRGKNPLGVRKY